MDTIIDGDVASARTNDWHSIDWKATTRAVRRLQTRIAKAARDGDNRRLARLQMLLVRSTAAKEVAVRRVTENQGRKTPGVDGVVWSSPEAKAKAVQSLSSRNYKAKPLRRVLIPKASGGTRPLGIPTMYDRSMQALHWLALDPVAETLGDTNSYGFRSHRSTADALMQCQNALNRSHSPAWVLEGDIKGCFDNISHEWLLTHIPINGKVLKQWLKAGYVEQKRLFPTEAGTPQGGIISPVLANMVLDGMEALLKENLPRRAKINFIRYADDFVVTAASKELLEQKVLPLISGFLRERGLSLSQRKTKITHISEGFDFLGWNVKKLGSFLRTAPSKRNTAAFLEKVRGTLKRLRGAKQDTVIRALNPVVRGWGNYHRVAHASRVFAKVDHQIHKATWQWSTRRHSAKGRRWIKARYYHRSGSRDWLFKGEAVTLARLSTIKVGGYVKFKSDQNPYDPRCEVYFDKRLDRRMQESLAGRRKLLWLWTKQDGKCPQCSRKITKTTGWNVHHVVWRTHGGTDKTQNLALLHPNCHRQLHACAKHG